jgi:hypothetical protein
MTTTQSTFQPNSKPYMPRAMWPNTALAKEKAFRRGFTDMVHRMVREWAYPVWKPINGNDTFDFSREENELLEQLIQHSPKSPDCEVTQHHSEHPYHQHKREVMLHHLRGKFYAMASVAMPRAGRCAPDVDMRDPIILCLWQKAVDEWAASPIKPGVRTPPPWPLEVIDPGMLSRGEYQWNQLKQKEVLDGCNC